MNFNRYDICWVDLQPVRGAEMSKIRPAVIVSLEALNRELQTVVVCPVTSRIHPGWRSRIQFKLRNKTAEVAADQIRVVARERLGRKIGRLGVSEAAALRRVLTEMYGEA